MLVAVICYGFGSRTPVATSAGCRQAGRLGHGSGPVRDPAAVALSLVFATSRHIARCRRSCLGCPRYPRTGVAYYLTSTCSPRSRNHRQRVTYSRHLRRRRRRRVSGESLSWNEPVGACSSRRCRARQDRLRRHCAQATTSEPRISLKQGCRDSHMARMTMTFKFHRDAGRGLHQRLMGLVEHLGGEERGTA